MASEDDVELFLQEFKTKMKIWDVLFRDDRGKNAETLLELDYSYAKVKAVLEELVTTDYVAGPTTDQLNKGPDLWVFGKEIKEREVYIKITIGFSGSSVICISFHFSEYPLKYPLK